MDRKEVNREEWVIDGVSSCTSAKTVLLAAARA
jgi:hypothetical protein